MDARDNCGSAFPLRAVRTRFVERIDAREIIVDSASG